MPFALVPALVAGVVGGAMMAVVRFAIRTAGVGLAMDVAQMWAGLLRIRGTGGKLAGMAIHMLVSVLIALIYALGFQVLGIMDLALLWGVVGGGVHWLLAGLFLTIVPPIHPEIPERRPAPGPFASNFGTSDVLAFLGGHLLYGLTVGVVYALLHPTGGGGAML